MHVTWRGRISSNYTDRMRWCTTDWLAVQILSLMSLTFLIIQRSGLFLKNCEKSLSVDQSSRTLMTFFRSERVCKKTKAMSATDFVSSVRWVGLTVTWCSANGLYIHRILVLYSANHVCCLVFSNNWHFIHVFATGKTVILELLNMREKLITRLL